MKTEATAPLAASPFVPIARPTLVHRRGYLGVGAKFAIASVFAFAWFAFSLWIAMPWLRELADLFNWGIAIFAVGGIAIVPGFLNAFLLASLLMDRRPVRERLQQYPGITILVAAFNEAESIAGTLESIEAQAYPGPYEVMVIDDGSSDATAAIVDGMQAPGRRLLRQASNAGKSAALNRGLSQARFDLVVTVDADCYLHTNALRNLVERYVTDPENTRAVAGAMLVRNSRINWVTRMQEWDYFHGIAATKRVQSLYQGTLVAQGAFSIYDRKTLVELGGWEDCVGEDIVLTWAMLAAGWRVGHAEDAVCFTNAPAKLGPFLMQRRRWARGMMEAFRRHPRILVQPRLTTALVWGNLLFPWLDLAFTMFFIPGIVLAFFGIFWIVGPLTLFLLPLSLLMNVFMYRVSARMFAEQDLQVRMNPSGFFIYSIAYGLILQPACVVGYISEFLGWRKNWGPT